MSTSRLVVRILAVAALAIGVAGGASVLSAVAGRGVDASTSDSRSSLLSRRDLVELGSPCVAEEIAPPRSVDWLARACQNAGATPAQLSVTMDLATDAHSETLSVVIEMVLPTDSWLVRAVQLGNAAQDPGRLATALIGSPRYGGDVRYSAPTLSQAAASRTSTAAPSSAPSTSPTPVPTASPATSIPPLTPQVPGGVTTIEFRGQRTSPPLGLLAFESPDGNALGASFNLSEQTVVTSTSAAVTAVLPQGDVAVVQASHRVVLGSATRFGFDLIVDSPSTTAGTEHRHTGGDPGVPVLADLGYAALRALPLLAVLFFLRGRYTFARSQRLARFAVALVSTGGVASAAITAEQRLSENHALFGADSSTPPGTLLATIALGAVIVPALATAVGRSSTRAGSTAAVGSSRAASLTRRAGVVVVTALLLAFSVELARVGFRDLQMDPVVVILLAVGTAAATMGIVVLLVPVSRFVTSAVAVVVLATVVTASPLVVRTDFSGFLALFGQRGVPVLLGTVVIGSMIRLVARSATTGTRLDDQRWWRAVVDILPWLLAALLAVPVAGYADAGWYAAYTVMVRAGDLAVLVVVCTLVRDASSSGAVAGATAERAAALSLAVVTLFVPTAAWWFIPIPLIAGLIMLAYVALPRSQRGLADRLASLSVAEQDVAIAAAVSASDADRAVAARADDIRSKVVAGDLTLADGALALAPLRAEAVAIRQSGVPTGVDLVAGGFGHVAGVSRWSRGLSGAAGATLLGVPWIVAAIRNDVVQTAARQGTSLFGDLAFVLAVDVLRWPAYGFLFGWAYTSLRGRTGTGKSAWLWLCLAVPLALLIVAPGPPNSEAVRTAALSILELASVLLPLGFWADYWVARRAGRTLSEVVRLRRLTGVIAFGTSLTVAATGAVSTIVAGGVTSAFLFFGPTNQSRPTDPGSSAGP